MEDMSSVEGALQVAGGVDDSEDRGGRNIGCLVEMEEVGSNEVEVEGCAVDETEDVDEAGTARDRD